MRTFWVVQAGIGAAAIGVAVVLGAACSGTIVDTGTETSADTTPATETSPATDTETDIGTFTEIPPSCHDCACVWKSGDTPAGCANACDNTGPGPTTPNFCNGAPALMMCKACIAQRCGVSDPTMCN